MKQIFEDYMIESGLACDGTDFDQTAVEDYTRMIAQHCVSLVLKSGTRCQNTTFDRSIVECVKRDAVESIRKNFNLKEQRWLP